MDKFFKEYYKSAGYNALMQRREDFATAGIRTTIEFSLSANNVLTTTLIPNQEDLSKFHKKINNIVRGK